MPPYLCLDPSYNRAKSEIGRPEIFANVLVILLASLAS